jgi:cation diffusion facilitator CzcD-associated flavoprotein CzcO
MQKIDVLIIGSGFGGQCAAVALKKVGVNNFKILERRDYMGGTWCQNTYPGAAVDVQSPLYSISFEPYPWSQMFAEQKELQVYTNRVIDKHQLRDKTELNAEVVDVRWLEEQDYWQVTTRQGAVYLAKFVINASGPLSQPTIPDFKGKEQFQGVSFHTNEWNHAYDYHGKRVAIIGSGASAAQVIPAIVDDVKNLYVFQRTPHWVMARPDRKFGPFARKLLGNAWIYKVVRSVIYWSLESRVLGFKYSSFFLKLVAQNSALRHIKRQIKDPSLRQAVTPDYTIGCKRIILSSTLYPALANPKTTLFTRNQGISEITSTGIRTQSGQKIELDAIVYATGYDAADGNLPFELIGREGKKVADVCPEYPRAYLGTTMPYMPNFYFVTGPNTGIGHTSAVFIIEAQMQYIIKSILLARQHKRQVIEPTVKAEAKYTEMIHSEMEKTVWHTGGCNSWYQSKSGKVIAMFPGFSFSYRLMANKMKPQDHHIA